MYKKRIAWNKGLTKKTDQRVAKYSKPFNVEHRYKISLALKGRRKTKQHIENIKKNHVGTRGKKLRHKTKGEKELLSMKVKEWWNKDKNREKMSQIAKIAGKKRWSQNKYKKMMSNNHQGNRNGNWRGGISKEPYSFDFTRELKELIRKRNNYT